MFMAILAQQGGIVGGVGQALAISIPLTDEGTERNKIVSKKIALKIAEEENNHEQVLILKNEVNSLGTLPVSYDDIYWAIIVTVLTVILLIIGKFSLIERFSILLVASFTFCDNY